MKHLLCFVFMLLLLTAVSDAQKRVITGKVSNASTGEPLQGVNILADKSKGGAISKPDGTYSISIDQVSTSLIFSYVGFTAQAVLINEQKEINVSLQPSTTAMDEIVVIGYGTQKKSHLTGAVSKYKNDKMDEAPVSRIDQALQGKIAGVQIQNTTSESGSNPKIRVRGLSSINAGADPLVVVDGHPVPDGLAFVNMADVESVEVLKDAASSAIYGSRGSGGVIIITTKSGKAEKPKYNVKFSTGAKIPYERYNMMTTSEYSNMLFYEAALKSKDPGITPPSGSGIIANNERSAYIVENTVMGGVATNWQDQALRNAAVHNIQVSASGGKKELKYYLSGGWQKDQGMMYHSEYDKFSLRSKVDFLLSKAVKLSFNINPSYIKRERPSVNYIDFVRFQSFLPVYHTSASAAFVNLVPQWANVKPGDFAQARHFNGRIYTGFMPDGSFFNTTSASDPFNTANNTPKSIMETRTIKTNDYRVTTAGDITVNILPGLDVKSMGSVYVNYTSGLDFAKRNSNKDGDINRGVYSDRLFIDLLLENTATYTKQFGGHSINVLGGFTVQSTRIKDEQITGLDYPSDNITTLSTALQVDQDKANTFNRRSQIGLVSFLSRLTYNYQNKYLLSASYRRDGSSYFAPEHKWGSFPSISIGWVPTQEKFMDNISWLDNLKLRGSYGATGNNRIVDFAWLDLLYAANYSFGQQTGATFSGQVPSSSILANPDITWERTFQFNGGLDATLFNNAVSFSIDVYQGKTQKLLSTQPTMAFTGVPTTWNNIGRLQNRGVELELTTNNIRRKGFKWSTSGNISFNKNKLIELDGAVLQLNQGERTELYLNKSGDPFVQFFGYRTDGVWLSQQEINDVRAAGLTSALSNLFVPGGLKLVDINNDKVIDEKDRTIIGNPYPDYTWGITNNVTLGAFDMSFMFQGVQGGQLVNGDPNYNETKRYNRNYNTNRWLSPMFPGDGHTPYSTLGFNWMLTDYVIEDASYLTLREVIVGYTLPAKAAKAMHLGSTRLYFTAQNLYFNKGSNYRGISPEARFSSGPYSIPNVDGYQRGSYPIPKTFLFGIDINF